MERKGDWFQLTSGKRFYPLDPRPEDIDINDIAHALSMECRYSGHCSKFYSVAQHSVLVSQHCNYADALTGLLHDAPEGYGLRDFASPFKASMSAVVREWFDNVEHGIWQCIASRFGLTIQKPPSVEHADRLLLSTERRDLMLDAQDWHPMYYECLPEKIIPWTPLEARNKFLLRFGELR